MSCPHAMERTTPDLETSIRARQDPSATPRPHPPSPRHQLRARRHDNRVVASGSPLAWMVCRLAHHVGGDLMHVPALGYVVSGSELARSALLDTERFRKDGAAGAGAIITQIMGPSALANMEGEAHVRLRHRLQHLFTAASVTDMGPAWMRPLVDRMADRLHRGESVDMAHFARVFTGASMCHMNGIEVSGGEMERRALQMHEWGSQLVRLTSVRLRPLSPRAVRRGREVFEKLVSPADEVFRIGAEETIPGRLREAGLTAEEARGVIGMIMLAGMETTASAIPRMVALLSDLEAWPRLQAEPETVGAVIDEGLRLLAPLPGVTRTVAHDCEWGGRSLRSGRLLVVLLRNAMRDARVIERCDDFDQDRPIPDPFRHLRFGSGPHFCLGAPLASGQLSSTLSAMATAGPIDVVERRYARRVLIPSYARLVVRVRGGR